MIKRVSLSTRCALTAVCVLFLSSAAATAGVCRTPQWQITSAGSGFDFYYKDQLIAADMDRDGHIDLVARDTYVIQVAKGDGHGLFNAGPRLGRSTEQSGFSDVTIADFTGDGYPDIAAADYWRGDLVLFPSSGTGDFLPRIETTLPLLIYRLAAADFNGDGKMDLVYTTWEMNFVIVLGGDGAGHFTELSRTANPSEQVMKIIAGDFDGDGRADVAVTHRNSTTIDVLYGAGDGTFNARAQMTAGRFPDAAFEMRDLDGDGDAEGVAANWADQNITVSASLGGRTFAAPTSSSVTEVAGDVNALATVLAVADFTGDGHPDALTISTRWNLAMARGLGDGTLEAATFSSATQEFSPEGPIATADFDEDGRPDLAFPSWYAYGVAVALNHCGECSVSAKSAYPVINESQTGTLTATVKGNGDYPTTATGSVEFLEGTTTLGTATLVGGTASLSVSGLGAGDHTITAHYLGDENYSQGTGSCILRVTTATTTVKLQYKDAPEYGDDISVGVTVTSSTGDTPTGTVILSVDGAPPGYAQSLPYPSLYIYIRDIGTHSFKVAYSGDSTHPPSTAEGSYTSVKAHTSVAFDPVPTPIIAGTPLDLTVHFYGGHWYGDKPTGSVSVLLDGVQIATTPPVDTYPYPKVTVTLPAGIHYMTASYPGDEHYQPSHPEPTRYLTLRVLSPAGAKFDARGDEYGRVLLMWSPVPGASAYAWSRRTAAAPQWYAVGSTLYPSTTYTYEYGLTSGVAYLYRLEAYDASGQLIATAYDVAMVTASTDVAVAPGDAIKASQFADVLNRINLVRTLAKLPTMALPSGVAAGRVVAAADIQSIRQAIDESRNVLGAAPASFSDGAFSAGSPVRAADVTALTEATR